MYVHSQMSSSVICILPEIFLIVKIMPVDSIRIKYLKINKILNNLCNIYSVSFVGFMV